MDNANHVLIAGESCSKYARVAGMKIETLEPSIQSANRFVVLKKEWRFEKEVQLARDFEDGNTVGAVALGADGIPAAAVSTGGTWMKLPGRIGDSAILGAGIFADERLGASCATGIGEEIIRCTLSMRATDSMKTEDAINAARRAVSYVSRTCGRNTAGIITVDLKGRVGSAYNTSGMATAWLDHGTDRILVSP